MDKKEQEAIEKIVTETMNEILDSSGIKEAVQSINDSNKLTREEIMAEKNTAKRQQLIRDNLDLFKK